MSSYNEFLQILEEFRNGFSVNPNIFKNEFEVQSKIFTELSNKYETNLVEIKLSGNINNITSNKIKSKPETSIVHAEADFESTTPIDIVVFSGNPIQIVKPDEYPNSIFGKYSDNNNIDLAIEIKHWNSNRRDTDEIKNDYEKLRDTKIKVSKSVIMIVDNFDFFVEIGDFQSWIKTIKNDKNDNVEFIYINTKNSGIWKYK